jgi:hypothetical protein
MSPEQVRGKRVDKRADIWAFGVVLYEMVTGKRAFHGETTSDILAGVLKEEPEWSRTPAKVQPLLRRCLAKDPQHRLRDIGDAMPLLEAAPEATSPRPPWPWVVAVVLLAALFAVLAFVHFREMPREARVMITSINPPENTSFRDVGANPFALSPDGRQIAFRVAGQLWVRALDSPAARPLPGTEGALSYFWSPDSRSIAFFDGKLKRIPVSGGPVLTLADTPIGYEGSWSPRDVIIFRSRNGWLQRVAASGGTPTAATTLDTDHDYSHRLPWFLPDGLHFLFAAQTQQGSREFMLRIGALVIKDDRASQLERHVLQRLPAVRSPEHTDGSAF